MMIGISLCRNVKLANIFYGLKLIEAYGTGIRKIREAYSETGKKPEIETTMSLFHVQQGEDCRVCTSPLIS